MNLKGKSTSEFVGLLQESCGLEQGAFEAIKGSEVQKQSLVESVKTAMQEAYGEAYADLGAIGEKLFNEDVATVSQVIMNNLGGEDTHLNETTSINMLTASIATTCRKPMESNMHRLFDTQAVTDPVITIESYFDTLTNADNQQVDAFTAFNNSTFLDTVVESLAIGTDGIAPTRSGTDLLAGHDKGVHKIDKDARISGLSYFVGGVAVVPTKIKFKRGAVPYFDSKNGICEVIFEVETAPSTVIDVRVDAKINFATGRLEYLNTDNAKGAGDTGVAEVYFDLHLAFDAHTSAITLGGRNSFISLPMPTAPHFEVSETLETLTDVSRGISSLKGKDFVSQLVDKMVVYSSAKEDLSLFKLMDDPKNHTWELNYDYDSPSTYAAGSPFEWIKLNFINLCDLACTSMKAEYHVKNATFKIAVSPIMLRIIDNGYSMGGDESANGVLNYSVVAKTAANSMVFVSSERYDDHGQINMILGDQENSIVKTFQYYKYQSFLTDALQSSKNNSRKAVVFAERNLATVLEPVACKVNIAGMPHKASSGNKIVKILG